MMRALSASLQRLRGNSFFANAFYLMLSTVVLAAFGFVFWVIVTRTYDPASVGLATTLLSLSGLLSLLGLAAFDTALIRFLPSAPNKSTYISTALLVVAATSALLSGGVAAVLPHIVPGLSIFQDAAVWAAFTFFTIVTSLNTVINATFLAYKRARSILALNTTLSLSKVLLPFVVTHGNAVTVFILVGVSQLVALGFGLWWLRRSHNYRFTPRIDTDMLRKVRTFSFSMFVASMFNLLPPTLLPLIIVAHIGPAHAAFYYIAFTIASVLYTIAYASMQSVFAEGSHNQAALRHFLAKAGIVIGVLLLPCALLLAILSPFVLGIFGAAYAQNSSVILQLFALAALPVALYSAFGAIFKVTKNLSGMISMNIVYATTVIGYSAWQLQASGLTAVGWGWFWGNTAACVVGGYFLLRRKNRG
jgi:O-antigen/teichoic acid export membrane protein